MLAGAVGELLAETKVVVSTDGRQRSDTRCCQTRKHVLEIAQIRELNDVSQEQDQIDPSLGEPCERRVRAPSRCSGSKSLIQREPAGSSSQWRSLRTPMRTGNRLAGDEDHRDRDPTRERRCGLRLRRHHRARPHRRRADGHRRGEPGRARPRRARHPRPLPRAAGRAGPGEDRALVERDGARHVLVDRAGDHERRRRNRHRAVGSEGEAARRSRLRAPRRPDTRAGTRLPPPGGRHGARSWWRTRCAGGAGLHRAPLRPARRVRRPLADALGSAGVDRPDDQGHRVAARRSR